MIADDARPMPMDGNVPHQRPSIRQELHDLRDITAKQGEMLRQQREQLAELAAAYRQLLQAVGE